MRTTSQFKCTICCTYMNISWVVRWNRLSQNLQTFIQNIIRYDNLASVVVRALFYNLPRSLLSCLSVCSCAITWHDRCALCQKINSAHIKSIKLGMCRRQSAVVDDLSLSSVNPGGDTLPPYSYIKIHNILVSHDLIGESWPYWLD